MKNQIMVILAKKISKYIASTFAIVFLLFTFANFAQAQQPQNTPSAKSAHLNALMDRWGAQTPENAKAVEKAKKDAEKLEKDFKDYSDKAFQSNFDSVFNGKLKPSAAIDYIKVFEALSAGDIEEVGKLSTDLAIAAYAPVLGQYIAAMKFFHKKVAVQITSWGDEVYKTDTFKFFRYDLAHMTKLEAMDARDERYPAYVPSYMINYYRKDPYIGTEMDNLYEAMLSFEEALFRQWSEGDEPREFALQFGDLKKKPWWDFGSNAGKNSQWIVALGADPYSFGKLSVEKKMFNFFLYKMTAPQRADYMSNLSVFYIDPLIEKEQIAEQRRLDYAIGKAVTDAIAAINADSLQKQLTQEENSAKAIKTKYRKYLDDGLADDSIHLPMGMTADEAFRTGMKAVEYKKNYYEAIARLHALARQQEDERNQATIALKEKADQERAEKEAEAAKNAPKFEPEQQPQPVDEEWVGQPVDLVTTSPPEIASFRQPGALVAPARLKCLMSYDFSDHKQADLLALLPNRLQYDPSGDDVKYLLKQIGEICKPGYIEPKDNDDIDDWDDIDEVDDIIVSSLTEEEKWAKRDELAVKSEQDAARSEYRFNQQYASAEAQRQEEARIAAEKARKRAEAFAAIAQGLGDMAAQIQEADRQNETYSQQNLRAYDTSGLAQQAQDRSNYMKSCMNNRPSTPGFKSFDPNADRIACGQNYRVQQNGTAGSGNTYDERLAQQKQETTSRRAEEQRQAAADRRAAQNLARERAQAKKDCACYRDGKSDGRNFANTETSKTTLMDTSSRPANCRAHIVMGDEVPWHDGFFDGKYGNNNNATRRDGKEWCRFGS